MPTHRARTPHYPTAPAPAPLLSESHSWLLGPACSWRPRFPALLAAFAPQLDSGSVLAVIGVCGLGRLAGGEIYDQLRELGPVARGVCESGQASRPIVSSA